MAFAVSGAALFSILCARDVDQRLVLCGYRLMELLIGRLAFLGPVASTIAGGFAIAMTSLSHPARAWVLALGLAVVGLQAVFFGLAVGAAVPRELEGTLVLIGVIGTELATDPKTLIAELLPFSGRRRLIEARLSREGSLVGPVLQTVAYSVVLLVIARIAISGRVFVRRPESLPPHTGAPDVV